MLVWVCRRESGWLRIVSSEQRRPQSRRPPTSDIPESCQPSRQIVAHACTALKGGCSHCAQANGQSAPLQNSIDWHSFTFLRSRYDNQDFCSHRSCWICRHVYVTGAVADSPRIAFSIANTCKAAG